MTPGVAFRLLETATEDPRITRVRHLGGARCQPALR